MQAISSLPEDLIALERTQLHAVSLFSYVTAVLKYET
jgi:hypothetical protein